MGWIGGFLGFGKGLSVLVEKLSNLFEGDVFREFTVCLYVNGCVCLRVGVDL